MESQQLVERSRRFAWFAKDQGIGNCRRELVLQFVAAVLVNRNEILKLGISSKSMRLAF